MINITSKLKKEYTLSIGKDDKLHMFTNIEKIIEENPGITLILTIKAKEVGINTEELQRLKSYGIKMNMYFKNVAKIIGQKNTPIEEVECPVYRNEDRDRPIYKKIIRSGQTQVFEDGIILTENINETGVVISHKSIVLLKKNHGTIKVMEGSILMEPKNNFGEIFMGDIDITSYLLDNEEIKNANKVLIEKTNENIKYEIY